MTLLRIRKSSVEIPRKIFAATCIVFCLSMATINLLGAFASESEDTVQAVFLAEDTAAILEGDTDAVLVTFEDDVSKQNVINTLSSSSEIVIDDSYISLPVLKLSSVTIEDLSFLSEQAGIVSIEPDRKTQQLASVHIQRVAGVAVQSNDGSNQLSGEGMKISIIDNGINANRDSFKDEQGNSRVKSFGCFADESAVDACSTNPQLAGEAICPATNVLESGCFHGGAVADFAGGTRRAFMFEGQPEPINFGGIAPKSTLISTRLAEDSEGEFDLSIILKSIDHVIAEIKRNGSNAPDVLNLSLGIEVPDSMCNAPSALKLAVDEVVKLGVPVVAASGNDGSRSDIYFPACLPSTIAVGATELTTDSQGNITGEKVAGFSSTNSKVDLVAPGMDMITFLPDEDTAIFVQGTSFAAPLVSGAVALMLEEKPDLTPAQIKRILKSTGENVRDDQSGASFPRLNIENAVAALAEEIEPEPTQPPTTQPTTTPTQPTTPPTQPTQNTSVETPNENETVNSQNPVAVGGESLERSDNSKVESGQLPFTGSTSHQIVFASIWLLAAGLMMMLFQKGITKNQLAKARVQ